MNTTQPQRAPAPSADFYDLVAPIYDDHWGREFFTEALRQFRRHLFPRLPHHARILDLCCGCGRFAAYLVGAGFQVTGVDASSELLAQAAVRAPRACLIRADMAHFQLPQPCDVAVCFYNALNHARDEGELRQIFRNVACNLSAGGYFLFDTIPESALKYWCGEDYVLSQDRLYELNYSYEESSGTATCRVKVRSRMVPNCVESEAVSEQKPIPVSIMRKALRSAGFDVVSVGNFRRKPVRDGRLIVLARRRSLSNPHEAVYEGISGGSDTRRAAQQHGIASRQDDSTHSSFD